jgi:hypothetical protein
MDGIGTGLAVTLGQEGMQKTYLDRNYFPFTLYPLTNLSRDFHLEQEAASLFSVDGKL